MAVIDAFTKYQVLFREVDRKDIEQLRLWRNREDIRLCMMDSSLISPEQQERWFETLSHQENKFHYAMEFKGELVGYANVTLDAESAETGLYIGHQKYRGTFLAFCVGVALTEHCFDHLDVQKLVANVLKENAGAIRFNRQLGYQTNDEHSDPVIMRLDRTEFAKAKDKLNALLSRFQ